MSVRPFKRPHGPSRIGVLLINLGGPEKLRDVKPFLYNLFSDPEIIKLPIPALQKPVGWLIATLRRRKSEGYYRQIGNGSPQRKITAAQAEALAAELHAHGLNARVYVGMACWHPLIENTFEQIINDGITHLVVLPLFPHFSVTTTGSAAKKLIRLFRERGGVPEMRRSYVTHYEDEPHYIDALADLTLGELRKFPDQSPEATTVLFSAHSIPQRYVERGDPYLRHTERTVAKVVEAMRHKLGHVPDHFLSFQSKVGPVKWLEPSTEGTLKRFAAEGKKQVLAVPVSFVSEHIETLYEMDIQYQKLADEIGLAHFRRVPSLNCHPAFIRGLAAKVKNALQPRYDRVRSGTDG